MKIEFANGLINFKILFLKAEKVLEVLIFKSKLFYSMAIDEEKRIYKKIMFTTEEGNLIIRSRIICFANAMKYSEEILRRLTFKYFEKVAVFYINVFYGVFLNVALDEVFL